jgi:predicted kinase
MQQTLFLMVGYPGSGKTTASKLIHEQTDAVHIWADHERHKMFESPNHSQGESQKLYASLNDLTDKLLAEGKSVIFDTNFNFYKDRQLLRSIADKHNAKTIIVWVTTPLDLSRARATQHSHGRETRVWGNMPLSDFERIVSHLQPPHDDEHPVKIDGTHITQETIAQILTNT